MATLNNCGDDEKLLLESDGLTAEQLIESGEGLTYK